MDKIQEFIAAHVAGRSLYYPAKVAGYHPGLARHKTFAVEGSQRWELRALMVQAGFNNVHFE